MSQLSGVAKALSYEGTYGWSLERKVTSLIAERDGYRNMCVDLRNEIKDLNVEIAGHKAVIEKLQEEIRYYRKDRRDQMIQDQVLPTGDA